MHHVCPPARGRRVATAAWVTCGSAWAAFVITSAADRDRAAPTPAAQAKLRFGSSADRFTDGWRDQSGPQSRERVDDDQDHTGRDACRAAFDAGERRREHRRSLTEPASAEYPIRDVGERCPFKGLPDLQLHGPEAVAGPPHDRLRIGKSSAIARVRIADGTCRGGAERGADHDEETGGDHGTGPLVSREPAPPMVNNSLNVTQFDLIL